MGDENITWSGVKRWGARTLQIGSYPVHRENIRVFGEGSGSRAERGIIAIAKNNDVLSTRHPGESRGPEPPEKTGFRRAPE
jgi:hypothetical protein